jgi:hypothetical protein
VNLLMVLAQCASETQLTPIFGGREGKWTGTRRSPS